MSYVKYDEDEIRRLHSEGLTDREIVSESNDNMTNIIKKHNECDSMIYKYGGRLS